MGKLSVAELDVRMGTKKTVGGLPVFLRANAMRSAVRAYRAHTKKRLTIEKLLRHTALGMEWAKHDPAFDGKLYELSDGQDVADCQVDGWDSNYLTVREHAYVPAESVSCEEKALLKAMKVTNALMSND